METLAHRRRLGIAGVLLLLASLFTVIAGPASAAGTFFDGNCNPQNGWSEQDSGEWGSTTAAGGAVTVDLNAGYSLELCVKGGSGYMVYTVSTPGESGPYYPPANCGRNQNQCGLSHWAIRNVTFTQPTSTSHASTSTSQDEETTSTSRHDEGTTSTTHDEGTTSTTHDEGTTSTTHDEGTTSTTHDEGTTSTTHDEETTTTTGQDEETTTTTGQDEETTTTGQQTPTTAGQQTSSTSVQATTASTAGGVGVAGIQVSAPVVAQVTQATLPFTGVSTTSMAVVSAGLAALGLLLLAASRRNDEKDPARSWS
ncbi:MAG: hypothetical protein ABR609_10725 [Acidimicrobiia bacterium]